MARVVLTTADESLEGIEALLARAGHEAVRRPLLGAEPVSDAHAIAAALGARGSRPYAAVAVTSPRAARAIAECVARGLLAPAALPPVWCAGEGTARALAGVAPDVRLPQADVVGRRGAAVAVAEALLAADLAAPVLFVRGEPSRDELPQLLRAAGVVVDELVAYKTIVADAAALRAAAHAAELLVVGSPRVADALAAATASAPAERPLLVALGPTTADAARAAGWPPAAVATAPTADAVAAAIARLELIAPARGPISPA